MNSVADLFPKEGHRFHLTMRRGDPRDFFNAHDTTGGVLAERARWLAETPARYSALLPKARPLLRETCELAQSWGTTVSMNDDCSVLGATWEPDFLLLAPDAQGTPRLCGGALCFPTGWSLQEKLGHDLGFIHAPVPGLNAAIGPQIGKLLAGLKAGVAFLRDNWGLAATDELNLHPARALPAPQLPIDLTRIWLRVEHQALVALPASRGLLFGIRIALHRLDQIADEEETRLGLVRALQAMPHELAVYKRIDGIRDSLIGLLSSGWNEKRF